jgi:hypothetical protein
MTRRQITAVLALLAGAATVGIAVAGVIAWSPRGRCDSCRWRSNAVNTAGLFELATHDLTSFA